MFEIIFYEDKNGNSDLLNYIEKLQKNVNNKDDRIKSKKISNYLDLLQKNGFALGEPYIKHLTDDIWELRPLKDRILFAYWCGNRFILLNYFEKKTQKTPRNEIIKAKKLLEDYRREYNEELARSKKKL